jgi:hypothetical protein
MMSVYPLVSGGGNSIACQRDRPLATPLSEPAPDRLIGRRAAEVKGERKTPWVRRALHGRDHEAGEGEIQPHVIA